VNTGVVVDIAAMKRSEIEYLMLNLAFSPGRSRVDAGVTDLQEEGAFLYKLRVRRRLAMCSGSLA
jgi:hypothetical protein